LTVTQKISIITKHPEKRGLRVNCLAPLESGGYEP